MDSSIPYTCATLNDPARPPNPDRSRILPRRGWNQMEQLHIVSRAHLRQTEFKSIETGMTEVATAGSWGDQTSVKLP